MRQPCLSVVITTYNREDFLGRAIISVLRQSMADFELIVVDDCSTDDTEKSVKEKAAGDYRLRYIRLAENSGVSVARNTGAKAASANYICFLDDDDEYLPEFLSHIAEYTRLHPNVGFLWTGVDRIFLQSGKSIRKIWRATRVDGSIADDGGMLFLTEFSASCGFTVSKKWFEKVGCYKSDMTISEDLDLVFRMVSSGCDYHAIPLSLVQVNIHPRPSLSRNAKLDSHIRNTKYLLGNYAPLLAGLPKVFLHYQTVLMAHYYRDGQFTKARAIAGIVLRTNFFYFRAWERILRFELKRLRKSIQA